MYPNGHSSTIYNSQKSMEATQVLIKKQLGWEGVVFT